MPANQSVEWRPGVVRPSAERMVKRSASLIFALAQDGGLTRFGLLRVQ
jgi:hypothetical protein